MSLTIPLIPPAEGIEQKNYAYPDNIHRSETQPKIDQTSRLQGAGREDVFAWIAPLIHEQKHGKRMDDIEVKDIEKEGNSPKDGHGLWKAVWVSLEKR